MPSRPLLTCHSENALYAVLPGGEVTKLSKHSNIREDIAGIATEVSYAHHIIEYGTARLRTAKYRKPQRTIAQHSLGQQSTANNSKAQSRTAKYSTAQHRPALPSLAQQIKYSKQQHNTAQSRTAKYSKQLHNTAQSRTARHSTVQNRST